MSIKIIPKPNTNIVNYCSMKYNNNLSDKCAKMLNNNVYNIKITFKTNNNLIK